MDYLNNLKTELLNNKDDWLDLSLLSTKKNVACLNRIQTKLIEEYKNYNSIIENYQVKKQESLLFNNTHIKKVLKDFYESPPTLLKKELQERRNNNGLLKCPFCGNPCTPDTLDHFIPKDNYPEYAIYANNLVPQCRECAPIKGEFYYSEEHQKSFFIHPFYSNLLSLISFKIETTLDTQQEPDFKISLSIQLPIEDEDIKKIQFHIKKLQIKIRVKNYASKEYKNWKNLLLKNRFDIEKSFKQRIDELNETNRYRDWKTALYKGFLENQDVMSYFNSIVPYDNIVEQTNNDAVEIEID